MIFDELAIITRPGAASRRAERRSVAETPRRPPPLEIIREPATLDGGDVLVDRERVYVGRSSRTNEAAIAQLSTILHPLAIA